MRLKSVESVDVYITQEGKIALEQESLEFGERVYIYLTLEQFKSLDSWVFKNKDEIELAWNEGKDDETQT